MTGDGSFDSRGEVPTGTDAATMQALGANVIAGLHAMTTLLRQQIRRFEIALVEVDSTDARTAARLDALRLTADRLENVLQRGRRTGGDAPAASGAGASASAGAAAGDATDPSASVGDAASGAAGRSGHIVQVEIRRPHLRALIESGALKAVDVGDPLKVQRVLQSMLDRWSGLYGVGAGKAAAGKPRADRRTGGDRRHAGPRANCLLSYLAGSPMDRRTRSDRRQALAVAEAPARTAATAAEQAAATAVPQGRNLVHFAKARAARGAHLRTGPDREGTTAGVLPFRPAERASSAGAAVPQVGAVDAERHRDAGEGGDIRRRERLVEQDDRQEEVPGRRDVLQQADGRQPDSPRTGDEKDQR